MTFQEVGSLLFSKMASEVEGGGEGRSLLSVCGLLGHWSRGLRFRPPSVPAGAQGLVCLADRLAVPGVHAQPSSPAVWGAPGSLLALLVL